MAIDTSNPNERIQPELPQATAQEAYTAKQVGGFLKEGRTTEYHNDPKFKQHIDSLCASLTSRIMGKLESSESELPGEKLDALLEALPSLDSFDVSINSIDRYPVVSMYLRKELPKELSDDEKIGVFKEFSRAKLIDAVADSNGNYEILANMFAAHAGVLRRNKMDTMSVGNNQMGVEVKRAQNQKLEDSMETVFAQDPALGLECVFALARRQANKGDDALGSVQKLVQDSHNPWNKFLAIDSASQLPYLKADKAGSLEMSRRLITQYEAAGQSRFETVDDMRADRVRLRGEVEAAKNDFEKKETENKALREQIAEFERMAAEATIARIAAESEKTKMPEKKGISPENVVKMHDMLEKALEKPGFTGGTVKEAAKKVMDYLARFR